MQDAERERIIRRLIYSCGLLSMPWAVMPVLLISHVDSVLLAILFTLCAGICAGGAYLSHRIPLAAAAYVYPIVGGVIAASFVGGIAEYWSLAMFCGVFALFLSVMTLGTNFTSMALVDTVERVQRLLKALRKTNREVRKANEELSRLRAAAEHAAHHDELTGLANRRGLKQAFARMNHAQAERSLFVLHIDLDRFKQINDTMGHAAGDYVLEHVSGVLRREAKPGDVVARVGGDEFVVIGECMRDLSELMSFAHRLLEEFHKPLEFDGERLMFGGSIGVEILSAEQRRGPDLSLDRSLANADLALYQAKEEGRGCIRMFDLKLRKQAERLKKLSDDMTLAIEEGRFDVVYQPQFSARRRELCGVEALARWRHPEMGAIAPAEFLPIAARIGLIQKIDQIVLEGAARQMHEWDRAGFQIPRLSVNISLARLRDPKLVTDIERLKIRSGRLCVEIVDAVYSSEIEAE